MRYSTFQDILCADACLVFIVTGIICAVLRWFHMCRPYNREENYFYPARKEVALTYLLLSLIQIPYFLAPSDDAVIKYIGLAGILYYPMCFSALFGIYFGEQRLDKFKNRYYITGTLLVIIAVLLIIIFGKGYWITDNWGCLKYIFSAISVLLTMHLFNKMQWLHRKIENYHFQNYSDNSDFPYRFAEKILSLPLFCILIMWIIFISGNDIVKMVADLLISILEVIFLIMILHPQRVLQIETASSDDPMSVTQDSIEETDETAQDEAYICDEEAKRQVLDIILRRFKEQHLQKKDILAEVDKGRMAPASRFIASVGYYNLINMFRLEYARQYSEANPLTKQSAVAEASGFASASSFSKAKKRVPYIDPLLVKNVLYKH